MADKYLLYKNSLYSQAIVTENYVMHCNYPWRLGTQYLTRGLAPHIKLKNKQSMARKIQLTSALNNIAGNYLVFNALFNNKKIAFTWSQSDGGVSNDNRKTSEICFSHDFLTSDDTEIAICGSLNGDGVIVLVRSDITSKVFLSKCDRLCT